MIPDNKAFADNSSKFTIYITPVLPGIMLQIDEGPPIAYINANVNIPLNRFKISNKNLKRITIDLNARFYLRQFLSIVDEYSLSSMYFMKDTGLGSIYYTGGLKFVHDRINNTYSVPISGGLTIRKQLLKWLYFIIPSNLYLYSNGYEIDSAFKLRMVANKLHLGCNIFLRGVFYSKYNLSITSGDILLGIGIGGED